MSRIFAGLDEIVTAFRNRRLDHTEFPYVSYLHVRHATPRSSPWPTGRRPDPNAVAATGDEVRDQLASRFPKIHLSEGSMAQLKPTSDAGGIVAIDSGEWTPRINLEAHHSAGHCPVITRSLRRTLGPCPLLIRPTNACHSRGVKTSFLLSRTPIFDYWTAVR